MENTTTRCDKCQLCYFEKSKKNNGYTYYCAITNNDVGQSHFRKNSPKTCQLRYPTVIDYKQVIKNIIFNQTKNFTKNDIAAIVLTTTITKTDIIIKLINTVFDELLQQKIINKNDNHFSVNTINQKKSINKQLNIVVIETKPIIESETITHNFFGKTSLKHYSKPAWKGYLTYLTYKEFHKCLNTQKFISLYDITCDQTVNINVDTIRQTQFKKYEK